MWSDTLLDLERAHLLRLLMWGGTSTIIGTALYAWTTARRSNSPLLSHFSLHTCGWGIVAVAIAALRLRGLVERDLASATRLDRLLWLSVGLDVGFILIGTTLAAAGWLSGRRLGAVGGGIAIVMQGAALLLLDLRFLSMVTRAL